MRICIVGPGAVGGNLAVRLSLGGAEVSVLARGPLLEAIRARGLRVDAGAQTLSARVNASDDPHALGRQDAVIVTVKAPALPAAAEQIVPLLGADTPVVFAVNGIPWWYHLDLAREGHTLRARLDPGGALLGRIGLARTIGCTVYSSNEIISPGVVRNQSGAGNRFVLGEPQGKSTQRLVALSKALTAGGIEAPLAANIRDEVWKKLLFNMAVASLCTITGSSMRQLWESEEIRKLCYTILAEGRAIASAQGTLIEATPEQMMSRLMPDHKPSMLQDLERGRAMEIEAILVAPGDFARARGVATPVFDSVVALIRQRAAGAGCYSPPELSGISPAKA